jgi:hypothetical protein
MCPIVELQEEAMRSTHLPVLCLGILGCVVNNVGERGSSKPGLFGISSFRGVGISTFAVAQGVRTPETVTGQPGTWAQSGKNKKTVDVTELKSQARELTTMSQALPAQMEQIRNGKYPKELIDNLKNIEKLAKRIRSEIE